MIKKIMKIIMVLAIMISMVAGCSTKTSDTEEDVVGEIGSELDTSSDEASDTVEVLVETTSDFKSILLELDEEDLDSTWSEDATMVLLSDKTATIEGDGARYVEGQIIVESVGVYVFEGNFEGQIVVDTSEEGTVRLVLNGVKISNDLSSPVYVINADKTIITLAKDSENSLIDTSLYIEASESEIERTNGALYSKDNLVINGSGSLEIEADNKSGILAKDNLIIVNGQITIVANNNGIKGKDLVWILDGQIDVTANKDGIKSDIYIHIDGGEITVAAIEDALHSDSAIVINDGLLTLATEDDALHSDVYIEINGGEIHITESYEGIESLDIVINGGDIYIVSSDDGINITEGSQSETTDERQGGGRGRGALTDHGLYINDGFIYVNAEGDGLDSNGNIWMTGGTVIVDGPTQSMNGGLDYDGEFIITGGYLVVSGSSGMAQAPSSDSTINSLMVNFDDRLSANTEVIIENSDQGVVLTYVPEKIFQSLVFSSEDLTIGDSYTIYIDGELYIEVELTDSVTTVGEGSGFGGGGGRGNGGDSADHPERDGEMTPPDMDGEMTPPDMQ